MRRSKTSLLAAAIVLALTFSASAAKNNGNGNDITGICIAAYQMCLDSCRLSAGDMGKFSGSLKYNSCGVGCDHAYDACLKTDRTIGPSQRKGKGVFAN